MLAGVLIPASKTTVELRELVIADAEWRPGLALAPTSLYALASGA
jgi:hypothetical protein